MNQQNKRPDACEAAAWCVMCAGEVEFVAHSVYDCEAWIAATQRNRGAVAVAPLYRSGKNDAEAVPRPAKCTERDSSERVAEPMSKGKSAEVSEWEQWQAVIDRLKDCGCWQTAADVWDARAQFLTRTNHDAEPAAKAPVAGMMGKPDSHGTGNTTQPRNGSLSGCETVRQEPVAFAVVCKEMTGIDVYDDGYDAAEYAAVLNRNGWTANVVRLVPQASPTLTDEERKAVDYARTVLMTEGASWAESREKHAATLLSLLEWEKT